MLPSLVMSEGQNQTPSSLSTYTTGHNALVPGQIQQQLSHRQPPGGVSTSISSVAASSNLGVPPNGMPQQLGANTRTRNSMAYQQHHTTNGAAGAQRVMRQPDSGYNYNSSKGFKSNFATFNDEQARSLPNQYQQYNQLSSRGAPSSNIYGGIEPLAVQ